MDIFCRIINNEIPSLVLYEDEVVKVILDVNPKAVGHTLILPKKHCKDLFDIDEKILTYIFDIAKKIATLLFEKLHCDGLTLMQNNGTCEEVKHFHLHLIPVYEEEKELTKEEVHSLLVS